MKTKILKKVDDFFTQFRQQSYKKGQIIIRSDDDPSGIFYLQSGLVKKYAVSKKGDDMVVDLFNPFSFFPMSWAMNDTPNTYNYEAVTVVQIWKAPKEAVLLFIKDNPEILFDLMQGQYRGAEGMMTRMTHLMAGTAYTRLLSELIIHTKRFGKICTDGTEVKIAEKDLAAQAGLTRETVSREIKNLKEKNLITYGKGRLWMKDVIALEKELSHAD